MRIFAVAIRKDERLTAPAHVTVCSRPLCAITYPLTGAAHLLEHSRAPVRRTARSKEPKHFSIRCGSHGPDKLPNHSLLRRATSKRRSESTAILEALTHQASPNSSGRFRLDSGQLINRSSWQRIQRRSMDLQARIQAEQWMLTMSLQASGVFQANC